VLIEYGGEIGHCDKDENIKSNPKANNVFARTSNDKKKKKKQDMWYES